MRVTNHTDIPTERRSKPKRVRATVLIESPLLIELPTPATLRGSQITVARLRALDTESALRLARHLAYQRRANSVEVYVRVRTKRVSGDRQRVRTCMRYRYRLKTVHGFGRTRGKRTEKLLLESKTRVNRDRIPKLVFPKSMHIPASKVFPKSVRRKS